MNRDWILRPVAVAALFFAACTVSAQRAPAGGWYGGFSLGVEYADTDYQKGVGINAPPSSSYEVADDSEKDDLHSARALLGYRHWLDSSLFNRPLFMDGELDAGVYSNSRVNGYLPGTGRGGTNVFPGAWALEKNRSASLTARVGVQYSAGTTLYLLAGVGWLDVTMEAGFDNRPLLAGSNPLVGVARRTESVRPWSIGFGGEREAFGGRARVEVRRTEYDFSWSGAGTGGVADPRADYDVDVEEWGIYVGYIRFFSL